MLGKAVAQVFDVLCSLSAVELVVPLVPLPVGAADSEGNEGSQVEVEEPRKLELAELDLLHEGVLADEAAGNEGDAADEGVGADHGGQLDDDLTLEFVGEVGTAGATDDPEDPDEGGVRQELGEHEPVEENGTEKASNATDDVDADLVGLSGEPAGGGGGGSADDEGEEEGDNVASGGVGLLGEDVEAAEGIHHCGADEEDDDASEAANNVVPEEAAEEGRGDTEGHEDDGKDPRAGGHVLDEASDLVGRATGRVLGYDQVVALISGVDGHLEVVDKKLVGVLVAGDLEGSVVVGKDSAIILANVAGAGRVVLDADGLGLAVDILSDRVKVLQGDTGYSVGSVHVGIEGPDTGGPLLFGAVV